MKNPIAEGCLAEIPFHCQAGHIRSSHIEELVFELLKRTACNVAAAAMWRA